jgi:hypothetical protein
MATTKKGEVLLLDAGEHGKVKGWRLGEDLIDSLPYVDPLEDKDREEVRRRGRNRMSLSLST